MRQPTWLISQTTIGGNAMPASTSPVADRLKATPRHRSNHRATSVCAGIPVEKVIGMGSSA